MLAKAPPLETMKAKVIPVDSIDDVASVIIDKIHEGRKDPTIRTLVARILSRRRGGSWVVPPRAWDKEVKALFEYVQNKVRYTRDVYGLDTYQRAVRTLQLGIGDCDDQTILLGSMLQAAGYPIALKIISTKDSEGFNHIYLLVGLPPTAPQKWMPLDPSMPYPAGWEVPRYKVKDELIYMV